MRAQDMNFNIALKNAYDPDLPMVSVIPQDLSRAILNIVNNGCYAAHEHALKSPGFQPVLRCTTARIDHGVEIRIRDNGTGIPAEVLPKIFNPFFTTKPTGSGTGLGLSLSYQIVVDQHKGTMRVETQEGEFTEFILTLPDAPDATCGKSTAVASSDRRNSRFNGSCGVARRSGRRGRHDGERHGECS